MCLLLKNKLLYLFLSSNGYMFLRGVGTQERKWSILCFIGLIYRVSQEEWIKLREGAPYVKLYRYNPKHLYPKLNGYGDNGHRKVGACVVSTYCSLRDAIYVHCA